MPLKLRFQIPSAALRSAATEAASKGRATVYKGLRDASSVVGQRLSEFAYKKLSPEGAEVYTKGISVGVQENPPSLKVVIRGEVPNALEEGFAGFDIKPGLLDSPRAKESKTGGKYIDVPLKPKKSELQKLAQDIGAKGKTALAMLTKSNTAIRRVSDRSKPSSWMHPGFKGIHAIEALGDWIRKTTMEIVSRHLKNGGLL